MIFRQSPRTGAARAAVAAAVAGALAAPSGAAAALPPNVVVIVADDLGYGELGASGEFAVPTPHLDALAASGVRFTQGYVTAPNCSPSRAGLMTGKVPLRFGYEFNPVGAANEEPGVGLPAGEATLAEVMRGAGYATGLVGKWHLGGAAACHPQRHGFDEFFGFLHEGHFYVPPPWEGVTTFLRRKALPGGGEGRWGEATSLVFSTHMGHDEPPYDADNPVLRGGQPVGEVAYLTDAFTRETVDFIGRHRDRPFFLLLSYSAVHSPLQAADEYMDRFAHVGNLHRRVFMAMLANLDDGVGAVVAKLRAEGLEEQTLLFFLSDNGGPTRELTSSNHPLRGGKGDMYEGGVRVPFLAQWKGVLPAGLVYERPVSATDILPTAAAAAGTEVPADLDGVDLLPFLNGAAPGDPHPVLFWRQGARAALRDGDWKLVRGGTGRRPGGWELYDLSADPGETRDLAAGRPEVLARMVAEWEAREAGMAEPLFR